MPILASFSSSSRSAGFFKLPATTVARGRLYMWGANYWGTGSGNFSYSPSGATINTPSTNLTWTNLAIGAINGYYNGDYTVCLFVRADGTLWGVGYADYGQFGDGTTQKPSIQQIGSATNWNKVACGYTHCIAIKTDGTLWGSGTPNWAGRPSHLSGAWSQIGTDTNWAQISCGAYHSVALKTNGTLWAVGQNGNGQLGLGDTSTRTTFTQVGTSTWSKIFAGSYSTMGIQTTGATFGWGNYAGMGQCSGNFSSPIQMTPNMVDISIGSGHAIGVTTTGTMRGWGSTNTWGQQGYGSFSVTCLGSNILGQQIGSATNWLQVSATDYSSFAINTVGNLFGWGLNNSANVYNGNPTGQGDCFSADYSKQLGFNNSINYSYDQSYAYYSCYSGECGWDESYWGPICCDPYEPPSYFTGSYTVNCYAGRYASPVTIAVADGNRFLALAQGSSSNSMAAIRTS
jgi:alpha-tubulin suppressor-like RCC1 family protein